MKFIIASNNKHKLLEISRILKPLGAEAVSAREAGAAELEPEENGETFAENAYIKAKAFCEHTGAPCIADDSGLCVDYLDGEPGVYSARYAGIHGDDEANIDKLLEKLDGVPVKERTARFVCAVCCVFPDGTMLTAEGACEGSIGFERRGDGGFGYDPVFYVGEKSFAQLSADEKDEISHRGQALREFSCKLEKYFGK